MISEFESAQRKAIQDIIKNKRGKKVEEAKTRIEDVEDNLNPLNEEIVKLVPSDDLEAVKAIVNQIVDILSRN